MAMLGDQHELRTEINATPLIDVLLVLLIVVMVIMPVMLKMETLEVPREVSGCGEWPPPRAVTVGVLASGDIDLGGVGARRVIPGTELRGAIQDRLRAMRDKVVYVDFEPSVRWDDVVHTMDTIRSLATDEDHNEVQVALALPSYLH